jgi:NAD(P)H-dependent FMN reductase
MNRERTVTLKNRGSGKNPLLPGAHKRPIWRWSLLVTKITGIPTLTHKLNIIVGSTRPGRVGPIFANWFVEFARQHGKFDPVLVDIAEFSLPLFDEPKHPRLGQYENAHTKRWSQTIAEGDAYVFVTPEYNSIIPAPLLNAITYLSTEWNYKPAGFLSYGGVSGGLRAVESAKPLLAALKVVPIPEGVPVPGYPQFLADGEFRPNELITNGATTMLDELDRWAGALKALRSQVKAAAAA